MRRLLALSGLVGLGRLGEAPQDERRAALHKLLVDDADADRDLALG